MATLGRGAEVLSVSIEPTRTYLGLVNVRARPWDLGFITYAGPWAEARAQWGDLPLDGEDENGDGFDTYVDTALILNRDDLANYQSAINEARTAVWGAGDLFSAREAEWTYRYELEWYWGTIQRVAEGLLAGPLTAAEVESLM